MGTLIDSSVLIAAQRGQLDHDGFRDEDDDEPVVIAAISRRNFCTLSIG